MNAHFKEYYWKAGRPYGREKIDANALTTYKIISDPYYKRICIEKYHHGKFIYNIYDSILLDFRHLNLLDQAVWHREILSDELDKRFCLLRNQDDRAILTETLSFESQLCRTCLIRSIHGIPLSTHRMFYKILNDPFDGVILYDCEQQPVMKKNYEFDPLIGEFSALISEEWNMENFKGMSEWQELKI